MKARKGDVIAVEIEETSYYIGQANRTDTRVHVATVTHATREGKAVSWDGVTGSHMGARGRVLVIPADKIAKADVLRVAHEHHWEGHPNQPKPFDSLEELREALRPYLITS